MQNNLLNEGLLDKLKNKFIGIGLNKTEKRIADYISRQFSPPLQDIVKSEILKKGKKSDLYSILIQLEREPDDENSLLALYYLIGKPLETFFLKIFRVAYMKNKKISMGNKRVDLLIVSIFSQFLDKNNKFVVKLLAPFLSHVNNEFAKTRYSDVLQNLNGDESDDDYDDDNDDYDDDNDDLDENKTYLLDEGFLDGVHDVKARFQMTDLYFDNMPKFPRRLRKKMKADAMKPNNRRKLWKASKANDKRAVMAAVSEVLAETIVERCKNGLGELTKQYSSKYPEITAFGKICEEIVQKPIFKAAVIKRMKAEISNSINAKKAKAAKKKK